MGLTLNSGPDDLSTWERLGFEFRKKFNAMLEIMAYAYAHDIVCTYYLSYELYRLKNLRKIFQKKMYSQ